VTAMFIPSSLASAANFTRNLLRRSIADAAHTCGPTSSTLWKKDRGNTVVSRNLRLTAIRSFYRMVALRDPVSVGIATRVLAIPLKRANTRVRQYLTREDGGHLGFHRPYTLVRAA
jgi:hypothetical protein